MQLWLSDHFDSGAWLGDDEMSRACVGRLVVGPVGLARRLALELGLAPPSSRARRAAQLAGRLRETDGFWSRSVSVAAIDTALALVDLGEALVLGGWDGRSGAGRLAALGAVLDGLQPGPAETLLKAAKVGAHRRLRWADAVIDVEHLAPLVARWTESMTTRGLDVRPLASPSASTASVSIAEPGSLLEAADLAADWLASRPGALVVGSDRVLDVALARAGLPTLGTTALSPASAIVRTFAEHAARASARSALACLRIRPNPIAPHLRDRLMAALAEWPSLQCSSWRDAFATSRAVLSDDELRQAELLLSEDRAESQRVLVSWAERDETTVGNAVAVICTELDVLRAASRGVCIEPREDARLVELATAVHDEIFEPLAGLHGVSTAGGVAGSCSRLLVWRPSEPSPRRWLWSREERAYLASAAIVPWTRQDALRRAVDWARAEVMLVAPRVDEEGRDAPTHTLIAELRSTASRASAREVALANPTAARRLPAAHQDWTFPRGLPRRERESPMSVGVMIGCSFRHAVRYGLGIVPADVALADGPLLYGRLAHEALHDAHASAPTESAGFGQRAVDWFEREGPRLAPALFIPSRAHDRDAVRHAIGRAGEIVAGVCADLGVRIIASEEVLQSRLVLAGDEGGVALEGRPDLVLGPSPLIVIDFKWSVGMHRELLRFGIAHQLALYAGLAREALAGTRGSDAAPVVGYLVLRQGLLLVDRDIGTSRARVVDSPPLDVTLSALRSTTVQARAGLDRGHAMAPGADCAEVVAVGLAPPTIVLPPPCGFCPYGTLCGRSLISPATGASR